MCSFGRTFSYAAERLYPWLPVRCAILRDRELLALEQTLPVRHSLFVGYLGWNKYGDRIKLTHEI